MAHKTVNCREEDLDDRLEEIEDEIKEQESAKDEAEERIDELEDDKRRIEGVLATGAKNADGLYKVPEGLIEGVAICSGCEKAIVQESEIFCKDCAKQVDRLKSEYGFTDDRIAMGNTIMLLDVQRHFAKKEKEEGFNVKYK